MTPAPAAPHRSARGASRHRSAAVGRHTAAASAESSGEPRGSPGGRERAPPSAISRPSAPALVQSPGAVTAAAEAPSPGDNSGPLGSPHGDSDLPEENLASVPLPDHRPLAHPAEASRHLPSVKLSGHS